jgi:hypothetical protein
MNVIDAARDLAQFLARQKQARRVASEHEAAGGVDDFNRSFLLRGSDLARALEVYAKLDWCRVRQRIAARDSEWLARAQTAETTGTTKRVRASVKDECTRLQAALVREIGEVKRMSDDFTDEVAGRMRATGLADLEETTLAAIVEAVAAGAIDEAVRNRQDHAAEAMQLVLRQVKDRMDERVAAPVEAVPATPEVVTAPAPDEQAFLTEEELARESTPEAIRAALEATDRIPPELKAQMLEQLPDEFPGKYRRLVGAYFRTLLDAGTPKERKP